MVTVSKITMVGHTKMRDDTACHPLTTVQCSIHISLCTMTHSCEFVKGVVFKHARQAKFNFHRMDKHHAIRQKKLNCYVALKWEI